MGGRRLGIGVLTGAMLLVGCASPTTASGTARSATSSSAAISSADRAALIYGLRTDPDRQGLVASYIGGECNGPARLAVHETPGRMDVTVLIGPDPRGPESCSAVGYSRSVTARLAHPLGNRTIWSGDRRQVPFDGGRLLVPSVLPAQFEKRFEQGSEDPAADPTVADGAASAATAGPGAVDTTSEWMTTYAEPPGPAGNSCRPNNGVLEVNLGPATADDFAGEWVQTAAVTIGAARARLLRQGSSGAPTGWAYVWAADGGTVEVISLAACDRIIDPTELLAVARSLKSA